nr:hypothetical protein [Tanacetum cinerariifolium]
PDIMFAVYACSRFQVTLKTLHLQAVKRIFRYLKGKPKVGLWYHRVSSFDVEAYSNSDYARANLDRKSTTGGCQFLSRRLISWQCKKQTIVATSTIEAEYVAVANYCGHHFIRDAYEKKPIQLLKIHNDDNVADLLTKYFDVSRSMIGSLMYLTASRPDIMFAVYACSRFQVTLKTLHLQAVKRIFRYLKGKPKVGLWYHRVSSFDVEAYSNSDYARANLDRKSTTGGCQFLSRRLISWQCKKQTIVATSTIEAEYVAVANYCGHHFIRDAYEKKPIQLLKIHNDDNVADLLTKSFDVSRPDIMFAVYACSRFQVTLKTLHLQAVKRIFRYLKGKPKLGLWYHRVSSFDMEAYSNSDYAGANLDKKSTTGGC